MNKKETAEFLGVSTRIVEKYAHEGKLGEVKYIRGKTGKQAEYDREAVEKLKAMLESPDTALQATRSPDARLFIAELIEAIANREQANIEAIRGLLTSPEQTRNEPIRTSEKLLLTMNDCRLLTGLSDANLRESIKAGKLKAKIIGRGYKIKRADLDEFISKL